MGEQIIGVDVGGTKISAGLFSKSGRTIKEFKILTNSGKGKKHVLNIIDKSIKKLVNKKVVGIGIGIAGPVDPVKGIVLESPNLPLKNCNIKQYFQKKTGLEVHVDNDVNCFAMAEHMFGQAKNRTSVIGITIGTGVGGGIIINNRLVHGKDNVAGEIGHITIDYQGMKCSCGKLGCLEAYISGEGIVKRTKELMEKDMKTKLKSKNLDARKIHEAAKKNDKLAVKVMQDTGRFLGIGLSNIIMTLNPEMIILGGSISKSYYLFSNITKKEIRLNTFKAANSTKIILSRLKNSATIGAASLVLKNHAD